MHVELAPFIRGTDSGRAAAAILRKCVHCGFCTATCPTYQLLGDELDGPRGRIYLIKEMLEGAPATSRTRLHLDRCLTCRSCETTCPSGVEYGQLVDIGREVVEAGAPRSLGSRLVRSLLRAVLPHRERFAALLAAGRLAAPFLPPGLRAKLPRRAPVRAHRPVGQHARRVILPAGCVQPAAAPQIDAALARVLDGLGINAVTPARGGCCGAVHQHLSAPASALDFARRNIDVWWPAIEDGAEAVVVSASACALMVKDYGALLAGDPEYADRAAQVSDRTLDVSEIVSREAATLPPGVPRSRGRIAFHAPCTLQHGQQLGGVVEPLLTRLGFEVLPVAEPHLCCGSAGTYSLLQPLIASRLLERKLGHLEHGEPERIATANIGCLMHLGSGTARRVVHWIELVDEALAAGVARPRQALNDGVRAGSR